MRFLYNIFLYFFTPIILLRLLWRSRRNVAYRYRIGERFAHINLTTDCPCLWIHTVSVGETIAAAPLIRGLLQAYPDYRVLVTTTTPTGSAQVRRLFDKTVEHVYLPYDLPHVVRRFLTKTQPRLALFMETELWPNIFRSCAAHGIPLVIITARLSERSMQGYKRFPKFTRQTLDCATLIAAQDDDSAERFRTLGAKKVSVLGNLKYDIDVPQAVIAEGKKLRDYLGAMRPIWIAASTHNGETRTILEAFAVIRKHWPEAGMILAPRHPEYFSEIFELSKQSGYRVVSRSSGDCIDTHTDIFLGDTLGELLIFYAASDVAFIGGSLISVGGHNPLEPAALGLPVLTGPYYSNFDEIYKKLFKAGAAREVKDAEMLGGIVTGFFADVPLREQVGAKGTELLMKNRGALSRTLEVVEDLLSANSNP